MYKGIPMADKDYEYLEKLFEMQNKFFEEKLGSFEKKLDGHIEQHKQNKIRILTSIIAPICTGFIGAIIGRFIKG